MQIKIGAKRAGKTQDLMNEFLDDGHINSLFVCFNKEESLRIKHMVSAAAEASELFPRGFKGKVTKKQILAKVNNVISLGELMLSKSRKGRGYLYIDNLDIALQTLASSMGYEIKTATIEG